MRKLAIALLLSAVGGCTTPPAAGPWGPDSLGTVSPGSPPRLSGRDPATLPPPIPLATGVPAVVGFAEPEIIDTRTFPVQIDRRPFLGEPRRPGSLLPAHVSPKSETGGPPNALTSGNPRPVSRIEPETAFPSIGQTPWSPPDPNLAVGPEHVLVTVNMSIAWYLKDGTQQFQARLDSTGEPGFFEELGAGGFTFDPKCFYDRHTGRFVVLALEQYSNIESWITFAVSDDSDPNGIWFKYRTWALVTQEGCSAWVDYPGFGYDTAAWYVTANLFRFNVNGCNGFAGTLVRVIPKAGPLAGGTATFSDLLDSGASWQVAQVRDAGSVAIVRARNETQLDVARIENPLGSPALFKSIVAIPAASNDSSAPTPLGSISIVGSRIMNAAMQADRLFVARAASGPSSPNAGAVWNEIDMSGIPAVVQSGRIDGQGDEHLFFPAIAVNDSGSVGLVYGRSSSSMHPRVETCGRLPCDPPGTMSLGAVTVPGSTSPSGSSKRWGDYFGCTTDPLDGRTFWWVGEWQDANGWRTEVGSYRVGRRGDLDGNGSVDPADLAILLGSFGVSGPADLDGNGIVNSADLTLLLGDWGNCVGGVSGG